MAASRQIVVATRNRGKLGEIRRELGPSTSSTSSGQASSGQAGVAVEVLSLEGWPEAAEPIEDGDTFAANARLKAVHYSKATGRWCLADDSGLVVDALAGRPGIHSARYAASDCPAGADRGTVDRANNARLLEELADVPDAERTARFVCELALADGERVLVTAAGRVEGRVLREGRGENGFGYDPVFYLPELGRTAAELSREEKNRVSHRGRAVRAFAERLKALLAGESFSPG